MKKELSLNEKLAKVQTELKAKKTKFNKFGRYYYRTAEDILEAVKPFLMPLKLSIRIKEELIDTSTIKSTAIITDGLSRYKASAIVAVDLNQKGMQMPQRFGTASSYGKKYALGNLFLIDDTQDADATNDHKVKPKLTKGTKDWYDVLKVLEAGKDWDYIEKSYSVSKDQKDQLVKLTQKSFKN
jgi:hypothetical protein